MAEVGRHVRNIEGCKSWISQGNATLEQLRGRCGGRKQRRVDGANGKRKPRCANRKGGARHDNQKRVEGNTSSGMQPQQ